MEQLGWIDSKRPRMISVQSSGCAPIVRAYEEGKAHSEFWEGAATVASGLRVPKAFADYLILEAVRHSGGTAISVSDADLIRAALEVSSDDGLFLCPEGGAAVAALKMLVHRNEVGASERVVVFNTASGLKYLEAFDHPTGHKGNSR
jgi:threonine synthase